MAKISRYDGNLAPFASGASSGQRTVFGDVTSSDALDDNINADFLLGWEILDDYTPPSRQDFNAVSFTATQLLSYLHQMGVAEWNTAQEYFIGSVTIRTGEIYISKVEPNTANDPAADAVSWKRLAGYEELESADLISYDNSASGLTSVEVQGAIDELRNATKIKYSNATSGLATTTVQGAIDLLRESNNVRYDNAISGLSSTNVKGAVDELRNADKIKYSNSATGMAATNVQTAIDETYNTLLPTGAVSFFAQSTAPTGWLKCNGSAISRTTYAALFAVIGTTYGVGDGSTTFNIPELRGEFLRAWDDGRGVDSGRVMGSAQIQQLEDHAHGFETYVDMGAAGGRTVLRTAGTSVLGGTIQSAGTKKGVETRPRNIALNACIKY